MRILFTGATGLAGRVLFTRLLALGHDVIPVSRRDLPPELNPCKADLEQRDCIDALPDQDFDCLLHFASFVPLNENHPVRPDTPYAISKYGQEQLFQAFSKIHKIPLVVSRLGYVWGVDMPEERSVMKFIRSVQKGDPITLYDGLTSGLHLIHQKDIAAIVERFLYEGEGIYNLCDPKHTSLNRFVDEVMAVLGQRSEVTIKQSPDAMITNHYSCNRLMLRHGLRPEVSLREGIEEIVKGLADPRGERSQ